MHDYLKTAIEAARAGAGELLRWQGKFKVCEKGPKDLVTQADLASQEIIKKQLQAAFPDHQFVGEEDPHSVPKSFDDDVLRWIVDPLDGTVNYVHGLHGYAVSIGLARGSELLAGVVLDPSSGECFTAQKGAGAFVNGEKLNVSSCTSLSAGLVAASFPANVTRQAPEVLRFLNVLEKCQALRRLGSTALNLCYVAAGRLDAYWTTTSKCWDIAAGVLIVQEAGGIAEHHQGGPVDLADSTVVSAATRSLYEELQTAIRL